MKYSDGDTNVFTGFNLELSKGERIALHGENGCGKSTLIKMLLHKCGVKALEAKVEEGGFFEIASGLIISYINQDTSVLKGDLTEYCNKNNLDKSLFFALLRQLDFERVQFVKKMEDFSEGQKKKVLIATSLMTPAHIYIWDEPLNYIDVFSRMQIEKLILDYCPTMIFVEHDVMFREKIATRIIEFS